VAVRTTQRFTRPGLRVSEACKDTRTSHYHESETGSYASLRPYRGCFCRHPGGLSSFLAAIGLALSICPRIILRTGTFVQILWLQRFCSSAAHASCGCASRPRGSSCVTWVWYLAPADSGRARSLTWGCDALRSAAIVNCWTQNGDYSMTPAKPCFQHRRRSTIRRSGRLPNQPAVRARDCSHRGSL
jgi:hypothetical protein